MNTLNSKLLAMRVRTTERSERVTTYFPPSGASESLNAFRHAATWSLTLPAALAARLHAHLFPGDRDEHGAIILAGIAQSPDGPRLLARDVVLATDGIDYLPGQRGYRMLTAQFVSRTARRCRDERLVYLAVHNHGGFDRVSFSSDDYASHQRGYPALLDIVDGLPVGAIVFAENAIAGSLWVSPVRQLQLTDARILGAPIRYFTPAPTTAPPGRPRAYDRQARLFGDRGQDLLRRTTVGVIGAGGIGSLLVELLARLGVGRFVIVDPDVITETNVPRITGSTLRDTMDWLTRAGRLRWLQRIGRRLATPKVAHMRRLIKRANHAAIVDSIRDDVVNDSPARRLLKCDYIFLAADSMQARLVFNAIVHAYLIPGVQVGVKVPVDPSSGDVGDVFAAARPVAPSSGCLWCNGLITPEGLQREAETLEERKAQRYVDEKGVVAPSVITLNAIAAAHAANDFLFMLTGLTNPNAGLSYIMAWPRRRAVTRVAPRRDPSCPHCGDSQASLLGRGDAADIHTRA